MPDQRQSYLDYLKTLGITGTTANKAADEYIRGINKVASESFKKGSSGNLGSDGINAITAGFIDMQVQNVARISTAATGKILESFKDIAKGGLNPFTLGKNIISALLGGAKSITEDLAKLDKELIERVRGAGGYVGEIGTQMSDSIREAMIISQDFGVATDDTLAAAKSLMENGQRMSLFNEKTLSQGLNTALAFTKSSQTILENAENFRNVGIGLDEASKSIEDIGSKSIKLGLSAKATSETLIRNLDKLNAFGFQNGIRGLGNMVQQAQSLKINMDDVFRIADKLYDPESAINLAANLQVVGGAVGDLADPIKLMYDATNNVESLQTSIIGAARTLATYNAEQGRFEVSGANLRRAKAMADALGMSMGELTNMAVKGAAKFEAMSELNLFPTLTDEQKEFVSNIATIKDGKVGFDVPKNMVEQMGLKGVEDGFVSLKDLSGSQIQQLQALQKSAADEKPIDIARNQFNKTTQILNVATAIYLRMLEDTRRGPVGDLAAKGMDAAAKFMQDFKPGQENSQQTLERLLGKVVKGSTDTYESVKAEIEKNMSPETKEMFEGLYKRMSEAIKNSGIQGKGEQLMEKGAEMLEKGKEKGKELINQGLEKIGMDLRVQVDINSNNMVLAGIIVDEIERTPQLRASLASSLVKTIADNKAYA